MSIIFKKFAQKFFLLILENRVWDNPNKYLNDFIYFGSIFS